MTAANASTDGPATSRIARGASRRTFLKLAAAASVAGSSLLAACAQERRPPAASGGGSALEFWAFAPDRLDFVKEVLKSRPELNVNFRVFPYREMHDKLLAALTSGKGAPDIADVEISRFGQFLKGDQAPFVPLNDRLGADIEQLHKPAATDPWSWKGKIYGIGNELNCVLFAYRKDVMDGLGVKGPFATWDQVIDAGKKVVSSGKSKMFGLHDLSFGDYYMLTQSAGSQLFESNGNFIGDNQAGVAAMQFLQDLVHKEQIAGIAPADAQNQWYGPAYWAAFRAEQYVAVFGPPWHLGLLMQNVQDQSGKWTVQPLPRGLGEGRPTASYGGTGMCITTQSGNADAAWSVIKLANLSNEGALADFKFRTVFPAYKPAYDLPELKTPSAYFGGAKIGELYASVAKDLIPFQQSPGWPEASDALVRLVITPVMQNQKDAKSALIEAKAEIEKTMKGG
jgi:arabinosaccharide transport system substrate-binding protein